MTQAEFSRYWEEEHGPLIAGVFPGVKRYVQNHPVRLPRGDKLQINGVAEVWYDDLEAWQAAVDFYLSEDGKVVRDDEEKFIDKKRMVFLVVEEKAIKG